MKRIDVHAHYLTEEYREAATAAGHSQPDGMPGLPRWNTAAALELMDANEIEAAILSISSPGVSFGDAAATRALARSVNEEGAAAVAAHPSRFGLFASLPLPEVGASLAEIEYAFDTLNADGVTLMTNYGGRHLGDPAFGAVLDELNSRKAVVFMHPTSPVCVSCGERGVLSYPQPMLEYMFESTRTVAHLVMSGTLKRCPDIRLIVPHAGAAMPLLSDRVAIFFELFGGEAGTGSREAFFESLGQLYYDVAGFAVPKMLPSLQAVTASQHLLYGSDWPFTPPQLVSALAAQLDSSEALEPHLEAIMSANARALFPRLS